MTSSTLRENLRDDPEFSYVTLVCEEWQFETQNNVDQQQDNFILLFLNYHKTSTRIIWEGYGPVVFSKLIKQVGSTGCAICCTTCNNKVFLMSHMTRKHITLWWGCIVCHSGSKASITIKLHMDVDHKNSEFKFYIFSRLGRSQGLLYKQPRY